MEKLVDECGGCLEIEEEEIKNHLRWARIRVKGPTTKGDDGLKYSLPVWLEWTVTYGSTEAENWVDRGEIDV